MRTFFQDFTRDNGLPITVEYSVEGSYTPTTYSPRYGAEGGDFPEFTILKAWPQTPGHERLARWSGNLWSRRNWRERALHFIIQALMSLDEWWRCTLTDAERERMGAWIAEHHEDNFDGDEE